MEEGGGGNMEKGLKVNRNERFWVWFWGDKILPPENFVLVEWRAL